jgi:hypothetical protein
MTNDGKKKLTGVGKADNVVGSDIATGGRWRTRSGVCDNVKCANKNGRCCANVGGRGVCVDAQEGICVDNYFVGRDVC